MKNSIFKGQLLNDRETKAIYESKTANPFDEKVNVLEKYGINDWEQLYSILNIKSLKEPIKKILNISSDTELSELQNVCESVIPNSRINLLNQIDFSNCPLGARKPIETERLNEKFKANTYTEIYQFIEINGKLNEVKSFETAPAFNFASSINHIHQLNPIRFQGGRGTCTSFAVTSANEFSIYKKTGMRYDLSEQHLFYESKVFENDTECGSWIKSAMNIISQKGQCQEGIWSYNPNLPCIQQYGKPSNADNDAVYFKNTFFEIEQNNIDALKQVLSSGRIIPFSIPVFKSWYESAETYRTGRITMPLPNEPDPSGHSMTLVGYQNDANSPGGGYFIIRNSWGTSWGKDNPYGAGYGVIPYAYIKNYCWEAFAF